LVSSTIGSLFQCFLPLFRNCKHALKGVILIWHAVIWVLWQTKNERIFRGIVVGPEEIFYRIQVVSWKCILAKKSFFTIFILWMVYWAIWLYSPLVGRIIRFFWIMCDVLIGVFFVWVEYYMYFSYHCW
jgi:hypothetical protein